MDGMKMTSEGFLGKIIYEVINMEKRITMEDRILKHLQDYGSITSWEAISIYGCTRLSHYIWLLRKQKYNITDETIITTNRYGDITHFKKYNLN